MRMVARSFGPAPRFPDFLCVGQQKAGTTWLASNLRETPGAYVPHVKELNYFNHIYLPAHRAWIDRARPLRELVSRRKFVPDEFAERFDAYCRHVRFAPNDAWYAAQFEEAGGRVAGEFSPGYALLPDAGLRHVRRLNPHMTILIIIRDPVDRAWSGLRHEYRLGERAFDPATYADYLDDNPEVLAFSDAAVIIRRWKQVFGDQVKVLFYDDLESDPDGFLRKACRALDLDPVPAPFAKDRIWEGVDEALPPAFRDVLIERLEPAYETLQALFPKRTFEPRGG